MTSKGTPEGTREDTIRYEPKEGDPFSSLRLFGTVQRRQSNIPIQTTPLVDREREFEALRDLVHRDKVRLITLTGPGGTGKTRLALEVASNLRDAFSDGVVFVPLAAVTEVKLVPSKIISTLNIMEKAGEPIEDTLKEFLRGKRTLLLLDNFEQVIDAAPFAAQLLRECQDLKIIVTSRAPLRVQGEYEFPVLPLAVPNLARIPATQDLVLYAAVALFVQRAQAIRADFVVTDENSKVLAEICTRLDGLPLALELAAARTRVLSLEDLLPRLQKRLELLTGGRRDLPERQQTLRNTIAWSYDLLDEQDKKLFRRLSVFAGNFSLAAAEAICTTKEDSSKHTFDQLSRLVEKSLLLSEQVGGEIRFRMLETIREFAHEFLVASGESTLILNRFVDFFLSLAEETGPKLRGPEQVGSLVRLDHEHDNLRAALQWSIEKKQIDHSLRFVSSLWYFWYIRGHWTEGRLWLTKALNQSSGGRKTLRASALRAAGALASVQDDYPAAHSNLEESIALFREAGDKEGAALALNSLGLAMLDHDDLSKGEKLLDESLALMQELRNKWGTALVLNNLGVSARAQGQHDQAVKLHKQSLQLFRELEDKRHIARMLINLGINARDKAEYEEAHRLLTESLSLSQELGEKVGVAESLFYLGSIAHRMNDHDTAWNNLREALAISWELGDKQVIAECLDELAGCSLAKGDAIRATRLLAACETIRQVTKLQIPPTYLANHERGITKARVVLGEKKFTTEWDRGIVMDFKAAVEYALTP
ncbi:MAG: ATP-binding protein [Candidatus Bathyarchaeia archaeon]